MVLQAVCGTTPRPILTGGRELFPRRSYPRVKDSAPNQAQGNCQIMFALVQVLGQAEP